MTRWEQTRRDDARSLAYTVRLNVARFWDSLGAWEQITVAGVLWTGFWVAVLHAAYPWLLGAVAS